MEWGREAWAGKEVSSWDFIKQNYRPEDRIAFVLRNATQGQMQQRIVFAAEAANLKFQRYLRYQNLNGADVYISMNTLKAGSEHRTKKDLAEIRHLYLDLDEAGDEKLERIHADRQLPEPNYILNTSPGKHQVIWKVEGFTLELAERTLRNLAREYGGDPAATDASRVLRLPGLRNHKYHPTLRVDAYRTADQSYSSHSFKIWQAELAKEFKFSKDRQTAKSRLGRPQSQSERDWAWVRTQLKNGVSPESVQRQLAAERQDKANPAYYARLTVEKAISLLR